MATKGAARGHIAAAARAEKASEGQHLEGDPKKRDTENVPFTYGGSTAGARGKLDVVRAHVAAEVTPHTPDASVDWAKANITVRPRNIIRASITTVTQATNTLSGLYR